MGLAWLTKTPAAYLVPTGAVLIIAELWMERRRKHPELAQSVVANVNPDHSWKTLLIGYVAWGAVATATFVVLWPAMWGSPIATLTAIAAEMRTYIGGHGNSNYFMGQ